MHDPCTSYEADPYWYAPDLIQSILDNPVDHEVGTHSFSHANFTTTCSDLMLVRREIEESTLVMEPFGIRPRSLVYPYNNRVHAYLDLLSELSITAVRKRDEKVKLSYPVRTSSGVYQFYESMMLRSTKYYDYLDKVKILLAMAMKRSAVFHLWFHPSEAASMFENEFHTTLQFLDRQRQAGLVWIATMGEIAAYCEAREHLRPAIERCAGEMSVIWQGAFQSEKYGHTELSLIFPPLSRPRRVTVNIGGSFQDLEYGHAYVQMPTGQLLINMHTMATSLHIVF